MRKGPRVKSKWVITGAIQEGKAAAELGNKPPSRDHELPKQPEEQKSTHTPEGTQVPAGALGSSFCSMTTTGRTKNTFLFHREKYQ